MKILNLGVGEAGEVSIGIVHFSLMRMSYSQPEQWVGCE